MIDLIFKLNFAGALIAFFEIGFEVIDMILYLLKFVSDLYLLVFCELGARALLQAEGNLQILLCLEERVPLICNCLLQFGQLISFTSIWVRDHFPNLGNLSLDFS